MLGWDTMANQSYLSGPHRLLSSYTSLPTIRTAANSRASTPDFTYDAFPRSATGGGAGARDAGSLSRAPPSPASSALNMSYSSVNDFPYGLSGVQMPTYNFGSELYNYVSNGFPRKSRMCTFCNKVFTRSTTRRYHERRCPLLRASNSLAKSEENSVAAIAALKEQHRLKESVNALQASNPNQAAAMTIKTNTSNNPSSQLGSALSATSPTQLPNLHPAYPSHFSPVTAALASSPSRNASIAAYSYAQAYGSHFYNSISAAALASLDQNSNAVQSKRESDTKSWASSPSPTSKHREYPHPPSSHGGNTAAVSKPFPTNTGTDLTYKAGTEASLRAQLPVFPANSHRRMSRSPSPEPGETRSRSPVLTSESRDSVGLREFNSREAEWKENSNEQANKIMVANLSGARLKTTSPIPMLWNKKARLERAQEQYLKTQSMDDEEEDEDDEEEEEDEEEVKEDEEQFNDNTSHGSEGESERKYERSSPSANSSFESMVCRFCHKTFSDTITKQAHEALHSQTKSFGCCLCSHAFHCAYSLRIHFLRHHNEGPHSCKYCPETYEDIMEIKSHILSQHTLTKQEACSLKYFSLLDNTECVPDIPQSGVSDSEQDTKDKSILAQRRSADSLPDAVKDSLQATKTPSSNDAAEQLTNGDIDHEEMEVCKVCNKTFARSLIRFHERAHADQKPYECPICNKRFGYKNNMKSHMKLHQGLKPYQCQICGARFTRGSTLRRHGRRHKISRDTMLDFVLYDNGNLPSIPNTTTTSATTNNGTPSSNGTSLNAFSPVNLGSSATMTSYSDSISTASKYNGSTSVDLKPNKAMNYTSQSHARSPHSNSGNSLDNERHSSHSSTRKTHPITSPISQGSPRAPASFLTSQALSSPMVGGLAAVAAANLFAYPTAAAPHLYSFYTSNTQLMPFSTYTNSHSSQAIQSDALNLSLGKRKSAYEEPDQTLKAHRKEPDTYTKNSPCRDLFYRNGDIKAETEEPGEMVKLGNQFSINYSIKKSSEIFEEGLQQQHFQLQQQQQQQLEKTKVHSSEVLKISTEDFAAQVNMCCPSPLVQSSTSSLQHQTGSSPVGSSSCCNDSNFQAHASPSGISHHSSPANSAPSPTTLSEHHLQELLLTLLATGKMFRCPFCDIYFTEYAMFRLHQKYHQCDMARPFLCSVCGEDCKDKTYFTVHLSEHLGLSAKANLA